MALLLSAVLMGIMGCRYRIGPPPASVGMVVGDIQAPVVEPGIADALAVALGAALRRAGAAGERRLDAVVRRADYRPSTSREGAVTSWEAELEVAFVLGGPQPRELVLQRSLVVATPAGGVEPTQLRAPALEQLAVAIADEAVSFFLYAPDGAQPAPGEDP